MIAAPSQIAAMLMQVVIPEEASYEVEYQDLKEHFFRKYRTDIPAEFTKVSLPSTC